MDYWGATYKEATEWLVSEIQSQNLENKKVYACNLSYAVWYYAKGSFKMADSAKSADYIICDYDNDSLQDYNFPIIHSVKRQGVDLNIVRKVL